MLFLKLTRKAYSNFINIAFYKDTFKILLYCIVLPPAGNIYLKSIKMSNILNDILRNTMLLQLYLNAYFIICKLIILALLIL